MTVDAAALWSGDRIGLMGGTFDPPHTGHVSMAREARRALALDRVLFSVAPRPPHKLHEPTSPLDHRVRMVEIAIEHEDSLAITHMEEAHEPSYTVDFLRACRMRTRADLYFIMGADSLAELSTWKEPGEILRVTTSDGWVLVTFNGTRAGGDLVGYGTHGDLVVATALT